MFLLVRKKHFGCSVVGELWSAYVSCVLTFVLESSKKSLRLMTLLVGKLTYDICGFSS